MTDVAQTLDRVVESMREPLRDYVTLLQGMTKGQLKTLALFGTIAAGSFDPARHAARNVLVVPKVDLEMLRRLSAEGAKLGKARIAAPLVMTPEYIKESLDTFPLELLGISQCHVILVGDDPFVDLKFDDSHVRLQCERELKTVLIGMRQGLLAAAGRDKILGALEVDVAEGLLRTLRGMLWLKGSKDALPAPKVLEEIEKVTDRKLDGIRTALDPNATHGWDQFRTLYQDVEALGKIADAW